VRHRGQLPADDVLTPAQASATRPALKRLSLILWLGFSVRMVEELSQEIDVLVPWAIFRWAKVSKYHTQPRISSFECH